MVSRFGRAALVLVTTLAAMPDGRAANATPPTSGRPAPAPPAPTHNAPSGRSDSPAAPQISQDAAARARMHECAHQWSSIKKAGNAGATTWKEFSATCLVVSK